MKRFGFRPYLLLTWAMAAVVVSAMAWGDPLGIIVYMILGTPIIIGLSFLWPSRWTVRHWVLGPAVAVPSAFVILISVVWTSWPLHLRYLPSKPALRALAARVERDAKVRTPCRAGSFTVREAGKNMRGVVYLWTDTRSDSGFVFTSADKAKYEFNVSTPVKLDDDVQFVWED